MAGKQNGPVDAVKEEGKEQQRSGHIGGSGELGAVSIKGHVYTPTEPLQPCPAHLSISRRGSSRLSGSPSSEGHFSKCNALSRVSPTTAGGSATRRKHSEMDNTRSSFSGVSADRLTGCSGVRNGRPRSEQQAGKGAARQVSCVEMGARARARACEDHLGVTRPSPLLPPTCTISSSPPSQEKVPCRLRRRRCCSPDISLGRSGSPAWSRACGHTHPGRQQARVWAGSLGSRGMRASEAAEQSHLQLTRARPAFNQRSTTLTNPVRSVSCRSAVSSPHRPRLSAAHRRWREEGGSAMSGGRRGACCPGTNN